MLKYIWFIFVLIILLKLKLFNQISFFSNFNSNKNIVFFHICSLNNWDKIFIEQLNLMKKSGLYNNIESINIGFLGEKKDITPYLNDKIKLVYHSTDLKEYEKPTINKLLEFSKNTKEPYNVLYLHSKGVSRKKVLKDNIKHWRLMMSYYLINNYKKCINHLKEYDTVGCNLRLGSFNERRDTYPSWWNCRFNDENHFIHYSGNFWWSKTDYLKKKLPIIHNENSCGPYWYYLTERWLLLDLPNAKVLEIKATPEVHLYNKKYDYNYYKKKKKLFTLDKNLKKVFLYSYF